MRSDNPSLSYSQLPSPHSFLLWHRPCYASANRTTPIEVPMLSLMKELAQYMSARKKWWLMPVIAILVLIGGLLVLAQGSAIAPFIYTVF